MSEVFNCYLMVVITLILSVFQNLFQFFLFCCFLFFFVELLPNLFMEWSVFVEVKVVLFSFSFIWRYFDLANKFFLNGYKVLDVIDVCCYCCLILLFVLTCFRNNGLSNQSNVAFFLLHWVIWVGDDLFFIDTFLKNAWVFGGFLFFPYLVDVYQKCGWARLEL